MKSSEMYAFDPNTVIFDGMFIIHTITIPQWKTMIVNLLIHRHHTDSGVNEVHLITPKLNFIQNALNMNKEIETQH